MFNDLINLLVMLAGFGVFLGIMGGVCFWIILFDRLHQIRIQQKEKKEHGCKACQGYETCVCLFADELPDSPCAYWKKKEP